MIFECSLGYIVNSLLTWAAVRSCLKTNKSKPKEKGKEGEDGRDGREGEEGKQKREEYRKK